MSAQKIVLVCLIVFAAFLANGLVGLMGRTQAVVSVSSDHVEVSVCLRGDAQKGCALSLQVERAR